MSETTGPNGPKIIAIVNQKGGVGKTTTAVNLGSALAEKGHRVLLVDLDPQGNATTGLGVQKDADVLTTYDLLLDNASLQDVVQPTTIDNLFLAPATTDLSSADIEMAQNAKRSTLLRHALSERDLKKFELDYVLIDCPPSLNLLTLNAMVAAHSVLVPLQCEFFALEGLSQLLMSIREIRQTANRNLRIEGVVLTMYDKRNNLSHLVEEDARKNLGELVFNTVIPRNVRVSEAPSFAMSVIQYDSGSKGSQAYRQLAAELVEQQSRVAA